MGSLRLGKLVRFIPYPVVGGFLAGTANYQICICNDSRLELSISNLTFLLTNQILFDGSWPSIWAALLIGSLYTSHYLLVPGVIAAGIVLFYVSNDFQWILL